MYIEGTSTSSGFCRVCVKESWDTNWHVGTSMLTGYYAGFDLNAATIAFTPLVSSSKSSLVYADGTPSRRRLGTDSTTVAWLAAAQAVVVLTSILLCMAAYCDVNLFVYIDPRRCFDFNQNETTDQ